MSGPARNRPATGGSASEGLRESQSERSAEDVQPATGGSASDRAMVRITLEDESPDGVPGGSVLHTCVCHPRDAFAWLSNTKATSSSVLFRTIKVLEHGDYQEMVDAETTWKPGRVYFVQTCEPSRFLSFACNCAGPPEALETVDEGDGDAEPGSEEDQPATGGNGRSASEALQFQGSHVQPESGSEEDQPAIGGNALEALRRSQVQPESGAEEDQPAIGGSESDRDRAAVARRSLPALLALSVLPDVEAAATTGDDADDRMNYDL